MGYVVRRLINKIEDADSRHAKNYECDAEIAVKILEPMRTSREEFLLEAFKDRESHDFYLPKILNLINDKKEVNKGKECALISKTHSKFGTLFVRSTTSRTDVSKMKRDGNDLINRKLEIIIS